MELKICIEGKDINFSNGQISGGSLDELIGKAGKMRFDSIKIQGKTNSYTFIRQVALFVNMISSNSKVRVESKSESFDVKNNLAVPIYK